MISPGSKDKHVSQPSDLVSILTSYSRFGKKSGYRSWLSRLAMSVCQAREVLVLNGKLPELVNCASQLWEQYIQPISHHNQFRTICHITAGRAPVQNPAGRGRLQRKCMYTSHDLALFFFFFFQTSFCWQAPSPLLFLCDNFKFLISNDQGPSHLLQRLI